MTPDPAAFAPAVPELPQLDPAPSSGSISFEGVEGITLYSTGDTWVEAGIDSEARLQLHPDQPLVIGRLNGVVPPYLDPHYLPTPMVPGSTRSILSGSSDVDNWVSRAHFMLRGCVQGIRLTNGVPHVEGGIRPPTNRTWMLEPEYRQLQDGEDLLIPQGETAKIQLPNGTVLKICADA